MTRTQGNNAALKRRDVTPAGYDLVFEEVPVLVHAFRRMVRATEFDVCEMAVTTYLCAREHGKPFTALPIFLVRGFHHGAIVRSAHADIDQPKQLAGTRVGVSRGYTVTTGVWARGIMHSEYGLDLDDVTWVLSGDEHVAEYRPPTNVVPMPTGADLGDLVRSGELSAAIGIDAGDGLVPLIADPQRAALDALRRDGVFPINHLIVVRDKLLAEHPDLAPSLFDAFVRSKRDYVNALRADAIAEPTAIDRMHRSVLELTGADPLPYGIAANRRVLERLVDHAVDQHILHQRPDIESLFAEGTRDREG